MVFSEWFDPYNIEHIKAYKHLQDKGLWPEGFVPAEIEMDNRWQFKIWAKMADCWIRYIVCEKEE